MFSFWSSTSFPASSLCVPQVLLQLCRAPACVETLVDTQELQCLMIGLTSLWDQTSGPWRLQASRVLRAVSAARPRNVVPALQGEGLFPCDPTLPTVLERTNRCLNSPTSRGHKWFIYSIRNRLFVRVDT